MQENPSNHRAAGSAKKRPDHKGYGAKYDYCIATLVPTPEADHDSRDKDDGACGRARHDDLVSASDRLHHRSRLPGTGDASGPHATGQPMRITLAVEKRGTCWFVACTN
jgi:hypothetical protein